MDSVVSLFRDAFSILNSIVIIKIILELIVQPRRIQKLFEIGANGNLAKGFRSTSLLLAFLAPLQKSVAFFLRKKRR